MLLEEFRSLEFDQVFNFLEGLLWLGIAGVFFIQALRLPGRRKLCLGLAGTFLVFGISDFIEISTRAWYSPWWLFVMKALCVVAFAGYFLWYRRSRQIRNAQWENSPPAEESTRHE